MGSVKSKINTIGMMFFWNPQKKRSFTKIKSAKAWNVQKTKATKFHTDPSSCEQAMIH